MNVSNAKRNFIHTSYLYCVTIEKFDNQFDKFVLKILNGEKNGWPFTT